MVDGVLLSGLVEFADLAHRREYAQEWMVMERKSQNGRVSVES